MEREEVFKQIPGYDFLEISNLGRVRKIINNVYTYLTLYSKTAGGIRCVLDVSINRDRIRFSIDRLVIQLFTGRVLTRDDIVILKNNDLSDISLDNTYIVSKTDFATAKILGYCDDPILHSYLTNRGFYHKPGGKVNTWKHPIYGTFIGSQSELVTQYPSMNLKQGTLSRVLTGKVNQHKGWSISQ